MFTYSSFLCVIQLRSRYCFVLIVRFVVIEVKMFVNFLSIFFQQSLNVSYVFVSLLRICNCFLVFREVLISAFIRYSRIYTTVELRFRTTCHTQKFDTHTVITHTVTTHTVTCYHTPTILHTTVTCARTDLNLSFLLLTVVLPVSTGCVVVWLCDDKKHLLSIHRDDLNYATTCRNKSYSESIT